MGLASNFISSYGAGRDDARERRRETAMADAGQRMAAGDSTGATDALLSAGAYNEANMMAQIGEVRRAQRNRQRTGEAFRAAPNPQAGLQAAAQIAGEEGDVDQFAQLNQTISTMTQEQRQVAAQNLQYLGQALPQMKELPEAERGAFALNHIQGTPFDTPELRARIQQLQADGKITNDEIDNLGRSLLTYEQQLGIQREDAQIAREDRRWGAEFAQRERGLQEAREDRLNPPSLPLNPSQARVIAHEYDVTQRDIQDSLGILGPALPYANIAIRSAGETNGLPGVNARMNDVALLRAAARAQTGPGVLTESEVWSTLSPSLQRKLQQNVAYVDVAQTGLNAADRLSLAQFVAQSARTVQQAAWDTYENYGARLPSSQSMADLGMRAPRLPHPDDMASLNSSARTDYVVGRQYTTPAGRTYTYAGPGNWQYEGTGEYRPNGAQQTQPRDEGAQTPRIASPEEYARLPSGTDYIDPQGNRRRKP